MLTKEEIAKKRAEEEKAKKFIDEAKADKYVQGGSQALEVKKPSPVSEVKDGPVLLERRMVRLDPKMLKAFLDYSHALRMQGKRSREVSFQAIATEGLKLILKDYLAD